MSHIPISNLRHDTAGVIKRAALSHEPVFITQHGQPAAVMVDAVFAAGEC